MRSENDLIYLAQHHKNDHIANNAMNELIERFDETYFRCQECDGVVCKKEDCCLNRIKKKDQRQLISEIMKEDEENNIYNEISALNGKQLEDFLGVDKLNKQLEVTHKMLQDEIDYTSYLEDQIFKIYSRNLWQRIINKRV